MYTVKVDLSDVISDIATTAAQVVIVKNTVNAIRATDVPAIQTTIAVVDGIVDLLNADRLRCVVPHVDFAHSSSDSIYSDVVNISDVGVLYGVFQVNVSNLIGKGRLKITIDGVLLCDFDEFTLGTGSGKQLNVISGRMIFNTSLLIEHVGYSGADIDTIGVYAVDA